MPEDSQGITYRKFIDYLIKNPNSVNDFKDKSYFRKVHSLLIKVGFTEIEGYTRSFHYGKYIELSKMQILNEEELETFGSLD